MRGLLRLINELSDGGGGDGDDGGDGGDGDDSGKCNAWSLCGPDPRSNVAVAPYLSRALHESRLLLVVTVVRARYVIDSSWSSLRVLASSPRIMMIRIRVARTCPVEGNLLRRCHSLERIQP